MQLFEILQQLDLGSGFDGKNHSLSAATGYQVYGLPTPLAKQTNEAKPPFNNDTNPTIRS